MLFSPYIRMLRTRTLFAVVFSAGLILMTFEGIATDGVNFLGAFWHHACNCPVKPDDLRILFDLPYAFGFAAAALSVFGGMGVHTLASNRFLLTRPQSRAQILLAPLLVSTAITALLPGLIWLLLLVWLHAVHAPSLGHLVADLELIPGLSQLGPHPSFWALAAAAHFGAFYLAGISLGLCMVVFFGFSRWLMQSRFISVKLLGVLSPVAFYFSMFMSRHLPRPVFFVPPIANRLTYVPSATNIAAHFAFAAAWFCIALWVIHDLEA